MFSGFLDARKLESEYPISDIMGELPSVIPIRDRRKDRVTPAHVVSASAFYASYVLNAIPYFRLDNLGLYDFFEKEIAQFPDYCEQIAPGFDSYLMAEINYIFHPDRHILIPENSANGLIYRARRTFGIHYHTLHTLQKAVALNLGIELFERFGCDRFGKTGETTSLEDIRILCVRDFR